MVARGVLRLQNWEFRVASRGTAYSAFNIASIKRTAADFPVLKKRL